MKYLKKRINESEFWGNAASGLLPICTTTKRICIGLRANWVNEPGTWGNFGGAIGLAHGGDEEEALSPEENAIKEFREESGYEGNVELIPSYIFKKDGFVYTNFLGLVDREFELNHENDPYVEVLKVKWVTLDELVKHEKLHFGIKSLIKHDIEQLLKYTR